MGLFDKLLGKKPQSNKVKEISDLKNYSKDLQSGDQVSIDSLSRLGTITHRDSSQTELILGRIIKIQDGYTIMNDEQDYIAFELPKGQKITEEVLLSVAEQYDIDKSLGQISGKTCYLGRVEETRDGVIIGNKSASVEKMIKQRVDSIESQRQNSLQESYQRNQVERLRAEEMVVQQIDEMKREDLERMSNERSARLSSPSLQYTGRMAVGKKVYMDYDGVDMQTGDILRLRKVDKVCKNEKGQYLYTAYINSVEHDHDADMFNDEGEPEGSLVAFVLPGRLEDFVNSGNSEQIKTILNLLSRGRNIAKAGQMTYIGQIDERGAISQEVAIASMVSRIQQDYSMRKARNNKNFSGDEGR